jgi:hypothetical protein
MQLEISNTQSKFTNLKFEISDDDDPLNFLHSESDDSFRQVIKPKFGSGEPPIPPDNGTSYKLLQDRFHQPENIIYDTVNHNVVSISKKGNNNFTSESDSEISEVVNLENSFLQVTKSRPGTSASQKRDKKFKEKVKKISQKHNEKKNTHTQTHTHTLIHTLS